MRRKQKDKFQFPRDVNKFKSMVHAGPFLSFSQYQSSKISHHSLALSFFPKNETLVQELWCFPLKIETNESTTSGKVDTKVYFFFFSRNIIKDLPGDHTQFVSKRSNSFIKIVLKC